MAKTPSFKRLILRAVLRQVSPMVIRLVSVSDHMPLPEFHDVFRIIFGWNGDLELHHSGARSRVQHLPAEDAGKSTLRPPAYTGMGRRRPRPGLCGRPRRCAP